MKYLLYIRWIIPVALVMWVAWQALFATSDFTVHSQLTERTPGIGVLLPAGRVERVASGVALMHEPVYVDIALPMRARSVQVDVMTTIESAPVRLGVRQGPGWDYVFPDMQVTESGGVRTYSLEVNDWPYVEPAYALRFLISSPSLAPGRVVFLGARASLERSPFSFSWLKERFSNAL